MLLAETLHRVSISYQNSPAKDSDSKVKEKFLTSGRFYTKSHTKINLVKAWPLGLLLADMPKDFQ